jgi:hypothetical protein
MDHEHPSARQSFWKSPFGIACTAITIAASVYLYLYHGAHVFMLLPYLLLAACPLMHVFMHRGHHHHGDRDRDPGSQLKDPSCPPVR